MMRTGSLTASLLMTALGCAATDSAPGATQPTETTTLKLQLGLAGAEPLQAFTGGSVRICGARQTAADPQYRCNSELPSAPCPCFDFDATGVVLVRDGSPIVSRDLCPSAIFPTSKWQFDYHIFTGPQCSGDERTDLPCYSTHDLVSQAYPNGALETLPLGEYTNHIICLEEPEEVNMARGACLLTTSSADRGMNQTRYGCGCVLKNSACVCDAAVPLSAFDAGCDFDPASCEIICSSPRLFACDTTKYIMTGDPSTLATLDTVSLRLVPLGTAPERLGALGARERDGFLYALTQREGEPQHLMRIRADGAFLDRGPVAGLTGKVGTGAFLPDGTYAVYAGDLRVFAIIDVDTLTLLRTIVPPIIDAYASLAVDPRDGQLWAYAPTGHALGTIALGTGTFHAASDLATTSDAMLEAPPDALFFDESGRLIVYGAAAPGARGDTRVGLYLFDPTTGELSLLGLVPAVSQANGTSCSPSAMP